MNRYDNWPSVTTYPSPDAPPKESMERGGSPEPTTPTVILDADPPTDPKIADHYKHYDVRYYTVNGHRIVVYHKMRNEAKAPLKWGQVFSEWKHTGDAHLMVRQGDGKYRVVCGEDGVEERTRGELPASVLRCPACVAGSVEIVGRMMDSFLGPVARRPKKIEE